MSEEEIVGILRMIQEQQKQIQEQLNRIEGRQITVKDEIESTPVQGSFASTNQ
jgi:hypothetical protein